MQKSESEIYIKNRNLKIHKACVTVCMSFFDAKPVYIKRSVEKLTKKYEDSNLDGINECDCVFREFYIPGLYNKFGAIVLPDDSDKYGEVIKFNINFYEIINQEKAEMYHQVQFYTGEGYEMIIHGKNPGEISNFRRALDSESKCENYKPINGLNLNTKNLVLITGAVLIFAYSSSSSKNQNFISKTFNDFSNSLVKFLIH